MLLEVVPGVRRMAALADANDTLPQQAAALQGPAGRAAQKKYDR
jgi:hypothetical protein